MAIGTRNLESTVRNLQHLEHYVIAIMNGMPSSKVMFSEVFTILRLVLTIPVTTATAERTFFTLRRLKNFLRSSLTQPQLNHTILLGYIFIKKGLIV